jgi:hypothetical protein
VAGIRELLSEDEQTRKWLTHLDEIGAPDVAVALPAANDLPAVLLDLAVPHEDIGTLVALLGQVRGDPQLGWLLERCTHSLVRDMGSIAATRVFPDLPEGMGVLHRYFYVFVFVAALPHVRAFHRAREIPDDISRLTLADLGRNMAVHRRRYGTGGLDVAFWLMLHFRAAIYQLGRLQFQRAILGNRTGNAITAAGLPYGPGDPALSVHIPDFYGPLAPAACDESFARAREFFARYFPEESYHIAVCRSWLLDDQLAEYLPADGNIVRFQHRFRPAFRPHYDDEDILRFVFGRLTPSLDDLPQRTILERAVVGHLKAGHHWSGGAGWLQL